MCLYTHVNKKTLFIIYYNSSLFINTYKYLRPKSLLVLAETTLLCMCFSPNTLQGKTNTLTRKRPNHYLAKRVVFGVRTYLVTNLVAAQLKY